MIPAVRHPATALLGALAATLSLCIGVSATAAHADIAFAPCANSNDFACGHLTVPLDPSGTTTGTLTLAMRRHRAPVGPARSAIVALAGGPGQAAIPFAEQLAEQLGPIAATRDLIVFDQRGIGLSAALSCQALERPGRFHSFGQLIGACGSELGPARAFYTTPDTVADIEAIRQGGGYQKLVLYGTSYGTKVAEEYAQRYPSHVEALVLDSVVTPSGPDPLNRPTFAAVPRILRQECSERACAHVTAEPVADLARLVRSMRRGPLRGRVIDGTGASNTELVSSEELVELLLAGDFSPLLRAEFVTAVRAAADGDSADLTRLLAEAGRGEARERQGFDTPLYFATICEEEAFPWSRAADPRARLQQVTAAARALPPAALAPFTAVDALEASDAGACADWPFATPAPPVASPSLPNVPTLILSGEADLRTPTANAREVASEIPDAHLLVVPHAGHSVLSAEPGSCAPNALQAMFAGRPIRPCRATPRPPALRPPPLPPLRLALVAPTHGYRGLPGRTLHAVTLSLGDLARQLALQLTGAGSSEGLFILPTLSIGGLRAGWARFAGGVLSLHRYSYIPGVTLSGTLALERVELRVGGSAAAHGTLRLGAHHALIGTLGGRRVRIGANVGATAAIVTTDAQVRSSLAARRPGARELARLIGRLPGG